jgi:hypothetical protein
MTYLYRNGVEYVIKQRTAPHGKSKPAKPRKFARLSNGMRRD